jgi:drug/metabolite transporter (DMT)-like permease
MWTLSLAPLPLPGPAFLVLAGPTLWAVLAGLFSAATWAFGSHLFGRALAQHRDLAPAAANLFKNGSTAALYALIMLVLGWAWPAAQAPWLLLSGLFGFAIGDALYFAAFPRCGVQLAALSANLVPPLAALLGFFVRGSRLAPLGWLGMAITLLGIAAVVTDRRARGQAVPVVSPRERRVGLLFAGLAAVSQAISIVAGARGFEGLSLDPEGLIPGTVVRLVGGAGGAVVLALLASLLPRSGQQPAPLYQLSGPLRRRSLALALIVPSAMAAWINLPMHSLALAKLPEGLSSILFALTPVFTLPIGLALGARYGVRTVLGTLLAFAGVALVILYGQPAA